MESKNVNWDRQKVYFRILHLRHIFCHYLLYPSIDSSDLDVVLSDFYVYPSDLYVDLTHVNLWWHILPPFVKVIPPQPPHPR